jgi:hypothetical protein
VEDEAAWFACGRRQEVRPEASWTLWALIRFSAWPRAQQIVS